MQVRRRVWAGFVFVAVAALVTSACYPPSQTPSEQTVPPGGRVVVTLPALHHSVILDTSDDVSSILYSTEVVAGTAGAAHYWVYDDATGSRTSVPVVGGFAEAISPDGSQVLFSSSAASLQVGPVEANCLRVQPFQPDQMLICSELYLYDVASGVTQQLTGLDGSSDVNHLLARFSSDGHSVFFSRAPGGWAPTYTHHRMDLASGVVEPLTQDPELDCCTWDRGSHTVTYDTSTAVLTSTDAVSGEVTTLFDDTELWAFDRVFDGGRYVLVSRWSNQVELFRLIDLDTGVVRKPSSRWISEDMTSFAVIQQNVAPDGIDRLIIAPFIL